MTFNPLVVVNRMSDTIVKFTTPPPLNPWDADAALIQACDRLKCKCKALLTAADPADNADAIMYSVTKGSLARMYGSMSKICYFWIKVVTAG